MIVELCGLPGSGKSTLAQEYVKKFSDCTVVVTIDMYGRAELLKYAILFIASHPIKFLQICYFVFQNRGKGLLSYTFHLWLRACAKLQKAKKLERHSSVVLIDEGLLHVLITTARVSLSRETVRVWVSRLFTVNLFCVGREGSFHRFEKGRSVLHPRTKKGEVYMQEWKKVVSANTETVLSVLDAQRIPYWIIPNQRMEPKGVELLRTYIQDM